MGISMSDIRLGSDLKWGFVHAQERIRCTFQAPVQDMAVAGVFKWN